MVYLYKCPFFVSREMDSIMRCGSDSFISPALLTTYNSISYLTEAMSLKMSYRIFHIIFSEKRDANTTGSHSSRGFVKYTVPFKTRGPKEECLKRESLVTSKAELAWHPQCCDSSHLWVIIIIQPENTT